jgi:hypothetical protein
MAPATREFAIDRGEPVAIFHAAELSSLLPIEQAAHVARDVFLLRRNRTLRPLHP